MTEFATTKDIIIFYTIIIVIILGILGLIFNDKLKEEYRREYSMKPIDNFRKSGYKQRYKDIHCVIYDLKKKDEYNTLPDTIIIDKNGVNIQLCTENIEEYTHLGEFRFSLTKELLQAIEQMMEE